MPPGFTLTLIFHCRINLIVAVMGRLAPKKLRGAGDGCQCRAVDLWLPQLLAHARRKISRALLPIWRQRVANFHRSLHVRWDATGAAKGGLLPFAAAGTNVGYAENADAPPWTSKNAQTVAADGKAKT